MCIKVKKDKPAGMLSGVMCCIIMMLESLSFLLPDSLCHAIPFACQIRLSNDIFRFFIYEKEKE